MKKSCCFLKKICSIKSLNNIVFTFSFSFYFKKAKNILLKYNTIKKLLVGIVQYVHIFITKDKYFSLWFSMMWGIDGYNFPQKINLMNQILILNIIEVIILT